MNSGNEEKKVRHQDAAGGQKQEHCSNTFDGKVVSMTGERLVIANQEGHECSHWVAKDAKLTSDGTACNTHDLKVGSKVRVTLKKDDRNIATRVEALDKHAEFAQIAG